MNRPELQGSINDRIVNICQISLPYCDYQQHQTLKLFIEHVLSGGKVTSKQLEAVKSLLLKLNKNKKYSHLRPV